MQSQWVPERTWRTETVFKLHPQTETGFNVNVHYRNASSGTSKTYTHHTHLNHCEESMHEWQVSVTLFQQVEYENDFQFSWKLIKQQEGCTHSSARTEPLLFICSSNMLNEWQRCWLADEQISHQILRTSPWNRTASNPFSDLCDLILVNFIMQQNTKCN